jgi:hypothetical protein
MTKMFAPALTQSPPALIRPVFSAATAAVPARRCPSGRLQLENLAYPELRAHSPASGSPRRHPQGQEILPPPLSRIHPLS